MQTHNSYKKKFNHKIVHTILLYTFHGLFLIIFILLFRNAVVQTKILQTSDLDQEVDTNVSQLESKMDSYIQALYGARSYILSSEQVTSLEWRKYIESMELSSRLPGMSAMSYVHRVKGGQADSLIAQIRSGKPFVPTQFGSEISLYDPENTDKFLVTFIEPSSQNRWTNTLGFDYLSEQMRSQALKLAISENKPVSTSRIQSSDTKNYGIVIMLPIYDPRLPLVTSDDKHRAVTGAVAMGFRSDYLFTESFKHIIENNRAKIEIFEGKNTLEENKLYDSDVAKNVLGTHDPSFSNGKIIFYREVEIASKIWTIKFSFESRQVSLASLVSPMIILLLVCFMINISLFFITAYANERKRS